MRAAFLLGSLIAFAIFSASCGGGAIENVSTMVTPPAVSLSPLLLNFASQPVGSSSPTQLITLTNIGSALVAISSIGVNGDFAQTNSCGTGLAVGNSCTIAVVFKPTGGGTRSGTLSLSDNAPGSSQTVPLSGTGLLEPAVSLAPPSLTFSSHAVGTTSAAQTITLTNTGDGPLSLTSLAVTGANASDFAQTNTCNSSLAAGGNCTISITFTPSARGSREALLAVTDDAGSPQTVILSGTGTAPAVSLSLTGLSFGSQPLSTTSTAQTITVTNTGDAALSIASVSIMGANANDFVQTNNCGNSVAAESNCSIAVLFTPSATGARMATLSITDNASGSPQTVSFSGTGTAPAASLSPTNLSFPGQSVSTISAAQTITLANSGNATLTITSVALTGPDANDFAQTNNCGNSVAAGANCTIRVTFIPSAKGTRMAALSVADNGSGSPQTVSVSGTGTAPAVATGTPPAVGAGAAPAVSLSAANLSFASQSVGTTSAAQTITLVNSGNTTLTIASLAIAGTNANDFAQTNNCSNGVAAGTNCSIAVVFTPSATGARMATLIIMDNATSTPQTVSLSGTATAPAVSLSPTSLAFASQPVGTNSTVQTITVTNTGNAPLSITGLAVTGTNANDFTETDTCGSSVPTGAQCTIAMIFTPSASGPRTATLRITDNANSIPQTVSLSGTGAHDVMLSWTASATPGVVGYYIYRGTTSHGESSTPLNSTPINGTAYTDTDVLAGGTYYYVMRALGALGTDGFTESANSNEVSATVPATE
jgi:hypothetical protein